MKKLFFILTLLTSISLINYSQPIFQKVTLQQIVTDTGSSDRCAWGDYDNDGFLDIVISAYSDISQPYNYPLMLYHNNGDGTFTRIVTGPIANYTGRTYGVAWGDYDNDGKLDLFVCVGWNGNNLLFHNEGNGNFSQIYNGPIVNDASWSECCAWCDYDRDGWLDLFVGNQSNQNNLLYHNNGDGTFSKITTGSIVNDGGWSRGCAWGDFDNDGWPDLFVVNYQGQNDFLYHNNGNGTFTRIFSGPEVNDGLYGSGCSWGDYDNDGKLDLFVSNNNQGGRLYHNDGNGNFTLYNSIPSNDGGNGLGTSWGDYDNDGFLDLFVANGSGGNFLYHNNGNGTFSRITNEVINSDINTSCANAWGDYNNDGRLDLFVTNTSVPAKTNYLYKNIGVIGGNIGNYLNCKLHGCMPQPGYSNTEGIGAKVKLYSGNFFEMREVSAGNGMGSQDMVWPHFGLGSRTVIDSIVVLWPSGFKQKLTSVAINQTITIDECLIGIEEIQSQVPQKYELKQNYPNPFNPNTTIEYSIIKKGFVKLSIIDISGRLIENAVYSFQNPGTYRYIFDGTNYSSGVYFYKLETPEYTQTKKMILIK